MVKHIALHMICRLTIPRMQHHVVGRRACRSGSTGTYISNDGIGLPMVIAYYVRTSPKSLGCRISSNFLFVYTQSPHPPSISPHPFQTFSFQSFNSIPDPTNTPPRHPLIHIPTPPRPPHKLNITNPSSTPTPCPTHKLDIANTPSTATPPATPTPRRTQIDDLDAAPTSAAVATSTAVPVAWCFFDVFDCEGLGASGLIVNAVFRSIIFQCAQSTYGK